MLQPVSLRGMTEHHFTFPSVDVNTQEAPGYSAAVCSEVHVEDGAGLVGVPAAQATGEIICGKGHGDAPRVGSMGGRGRGALRQSFQVVSGVPIPESHLSSGDWFVGNPGHRQGVPGRVPRQPLLSVLTCGCASGRSRAGPPGRSPAAPSCTVQGRPRRCHSLPRNL